jgi:hypothetical protein
VWAVSSHGTCTQCSRGVAPGDVKTFSHDCKGCQRKLAQGLRTGNEPHPNVLRLAYRPQVRYRGRKAA